MNLMFYKLSYQVQSIAYLIGWVIIVDINAKINRSLRLISQMSIVVSNEK